MRDCRPAPAFADVQTSRRVDNIENSRTGEAAAFPVS